MVERTERGREKIGEPVTQVAATLQKTVASSLGDKINFEIAQQYIEQMIFHWLLTMSDRGLGDEELRKLNPRHAKESAFILIRDFFRRNCTQLQTTPAADSQWVEVLFGQVSDELGINVDSWKIAGEVLDLTDPFDKKKIGWASRIARPLAIEPQKLAIIHQTLVSANAPSSSQREEKTASEKPLGLFGKAMSGVRSMFGKSSESSFEFHLTREAISKVESLMEITGNGKFLLVTVATQGDTYHYDLSIQRKVRSGNHAITRVAGIFVAVPIAQAALLSGTTLDYRENVAGQVGFEFDNPNEFV